MPDTRPELLTTAEVLARVRCSRSSLYRLRKAGFPEPIGAMGRCLWLASDIDGWLLSQSTLKSA